MKCPNCGKEIRIISNHLWECIDQEFCRTGGMVSIPLNRPTTPLQDDFKEIVENDQITKIIGVNFKF
jgi:hypothetical protein